MRMSHHVGVRELRQNLSVYLDRVKRGETLTVTEHRGVVAVLAPPPAIDDAIARLVAVGRATPAGRRVQDLSRPVRVALKRSLGALVREQGDDTV